MYDILYYEEFRKQMTDRYSPANQINTFFITIQSVQIRLKFPCKMSIGYKGVAITPEVIVSSISPDKFIFNHTAELKD